MQVEMHQLSPKVDQPILIQQRVLGKSLYSGVVETTLKFCKDCSWHKGQAGFSFGRVRFKCASPNLLNPVTGEFSDCEDNRKFRDRCGRGGRFFEIRQIPNIVFKPRIVSCSDEPDEYALPAHILARKKECTFWFLQTDEGWKYSHFELGHNDAPKGEKWGKRFAWLTEGNKVVNVGAMLISGTQDADTLKTGSQPE